METGTKTRKQERTHQGINDGKWVHKSDSAEGADDVAQWRRGLSRVRSSTLSARDTGDQELKTRNQERTHYGINDGKWVHKSDRAERADDVAQRRRGLSRVRSSTLSARDTGDQELKTQNEERTHYGINDGKWVHNLIARSAPTISQQRRRELSRVRSSALSARDSG